MSLLGQALGIVFWIIILLPVAVWLSRVASLSHPQRRPAAVGFCAIAFVGMWIVGIAFAFNPGGDPVSKILLYTLLESILGIIGTIVGLSLAFVLVDRVTGRATEAIINAIIPKRFHELLGSRWSRMFRPIERKGTRPERRS